MCREAIYKIYITYVSGGGQAVDYVECYFGINVEHDSLPTGDSGVEQRTAYKHLFSNDCISVLCEFYAELAEKIVSVRYENSTDLLNAFSFLQWVLATGLWKFKAKLSSDLERFTRNFDRLDVESERVRLYESLVRAHRQK